MCPSVTLNISWVLLLPLLDWSARLGCRWAGGSIQTSARLEAEILSGAQGCGPPPLHPPTEAPVLQSPTVLFGENFLLPGGALVAEMG